MEESDKVSSTAPDEAPHDVALNEAAAVGQTRTDAEMSEKTGSPEVTSTSQTTEETNSPQIILETSAPQIIEETSAPQTTEETNIPQITEITSTSQTTEETKVSTPQTIEETSAPQTTEETSISQTTEETSAPQMTEAISAPQRAEETSPPQVTELTSPPEPAEESAAPAVSEAPAEGKHTSSEADEVIPAEATEVTSSSQQTEAREDRVTPPAAEESRRDLSSEAPEEEEEHPHTLHPSPSHDPEPSPAPAVAPALFQPQFPSVLDLLHWRDVKSSALVFGSSLFILLSLTCCSIISVLSYAALALLSVTVTFRIYKGVLQAIQKSDEGHPFKWFLEKDVALSREAVQRHSDVVLIRINGVLKELRRLFLVEDLVDSLKFAVLLWIFTYVGSWFNGLTLLILGLVGAFGGPITYEKHQTQIDQFISTVNGQMKGVLGKIHANVPGAKKKPE